MALGLLEMPLVEMHFEHDDSEVLLLVVLALLLAKVVSMFSLFASHAA